MGHGWFQDAYFTHQLISWCLGFVLSQTDNNKTKMAGCTV